MKKIMQLNFIYNKTNKLATKAPIIAHCDANFEAEAFILKSITVHFTYHNKKLQKEQHLICHFLHLQRK